MTTAIKPSKRLIARVETYLRRLAGTRKLTALDRKIARNIAKGRLMTLAHLR